MQNQTGTGYLKVQTYSGEGAFPIESAAVIITDSDGKSIASLRTDRSGLTETISLEAPPRELSQAPSYDGRIPYSTYTVQINKDGFYPVEDYTVPIFDGITAIQRVNMLPLTEFYPLFSNPLLQNVETPGYPNLQGDPANESNGGDNV